MLKLAKLNNQYAKSILLKNPNRFLETLIMIEEAKLEGLMQDSGKGMSIEDTLPRLTEKYGVLFRVNEITFIEYKNFLEDYARSSKKK